MAACSVALKCEGLCVGCSTASIACYGGLHPIYGWQAFLSAVPPYTQAFSFEANNGYMDMDDSNFENLIELRILNITSVYPYVTQLRISGSVFAPLAKLQILKINVQWAFHKPLDDLFQPLVHLEELDLSQTKRLNITNLRRAMYGLSNSTTLKTINLSNIQMNSDDEGQFYHSTLNLTWFLEPLQHCPIRHLYLANNSFKEIHPGIIQYAPYLEYINVSHNHLIIFISSVQLYPLVMPLTFFQETLMHKRLQEIDFSYQGHTCEERSANRFDSRILGELKSNADSRFLELWSNFESRILGELWRNDSFPSFIPLEFWDVCYSSSIIFGQCFIFSPACNFTLDQLRHNQSHFCEAMSAAIDPFYMRFYNEMPCSAWPTVDDTFSKNCAHCTVYPTMGSATHLRLNSHDLLFKYSDSFFDTSYNSSYNVCFHPSNQLEYVDLSGNVGLFPDHQLTITGLIHLKVLNVSHTGITSVFSNMSLTFPDLQIMDMSWNKVAFYNETSMSLGSNIQFLNFSHNQITFVPQNLFSNSVSLQKLDLSHNNIHDFDFDISGLYSLDNLILEYNMISELPDTTRKQLIQLAERIAPRVITLDLNNNQLACSCSNISSLSFMSQTKPTNLMFKNYDKYVCINRDNDRVNIQHMNLHSLQFDCLGSGVYVGIGFACAFVVITIILLLAVTIHRKRWWFRYQYFLAHRVWKNYHKRDNEDAQFEYDLFVSYNRSDYQWVDEVLQPKLEGELGLRLCLHHRDFRLGEVITEQIIESVQSSKKTLFILSKSFLASTWCHFEIRMAQTRLFTSGKDIILLALLEPLPDRMISRTLKGLLETRTYVE